MPKDKDSELSSSTGSVENSAERRKEFFEYESFKFKFEEAKKTFGHEPNLEEIIMFLKKEDPETAQILDENFSESQGLFQNFLEMYHSKENSSEKLLFEAQKEVVIQKPWFGPVSKDFLVLFQKWEQEQKDNQNSAEIFKIQAQKLSALTESYQQLYEAHRPSDVGVPMEFSQKMGEDIWKEYADMVSRHISQGYPDLQKARDLKGKITEKIREEYTICKIFQESLKNPKNLERSIQHCIKADEDPEKIDNDQIFRFLSAITGKKLSTEVGKGFLLDEVLNYRIKLEQQYHQKIEAGQTEVRSVFEGILEEATQENFSSRAEYENFIKTQVFGRLPEYFARPSIKLPNAEWDRLRDNFMVPRTNELWQKHCEIGAQKTWEILEARLEEAKKQNFETKEALIAFLQETTRVLNQGKRVPDEYWNEFVSPALKARVDILWETRLQEKNEVSAQVQNAMKSVRIGQEELLSAKPKTEADFFELGKKKLEAVYGKIPDKDWDAHLQAFFYPRMRDQMRENEKIVGAMMQSAPPLDSKTAEECPNEAAYFAKFKENFAKASGEKIFGLVPDILYDKCRSQFLFPRMQACFTEHQKKQREVVEKSRELLNNTYLVKTVHHFAKNKPLKTPSAEDYYKSSAKALKSARGLTDSQLKMLDPDLWRYAEQARQEHQSRRSAALLEVENYTRRLPNGVKFSADELQTPIDPRNPASSGFYNKLVASIGYMKFSHPDDWYLVTEEAMMAVESLRKTQEAALKTTETGAGKIEDSKKTNTVRTAMENVRLSLGDFNGISLKTREDFERLVKEKLKPVHGLVQDETWDKLRDTVFKNRVEGLLNENKFLVEKSMKSFVLPTALPEENEATYVNRVKSLFSTEKGAKTFGLIPDAEYDAVRDTHLISRAKEYFGTQKKSETAGQIQKNETSEIFGDQVPVWAGRWGLVHNGESVKNLNKTGVGRLGELLQDSRCGLGGIEAVYAEKFGHLLVNLLGRMTDSQNFDRVKSALVESNLSGISHPKTRFLMLTRTVLQKGYPTGEETLKSIKSELGPNMEATFNNFFGISILGLRSQTEDLKIGEREVLEKKAESPQDDKKQEIEEENLPEALKTEPELKDLSMNSATKTGAQAQVTSDEKEVDTSPTKEDAPKTENAALETAEDDFSKNESKKNMADIGAETKINTQKMPESPQKLEAEFPIILPEIEAEILEEKKPEIAVLQNEKPETEKDKKSESINIKTPEDLLATEEEAKGKTKSAEIIEIFETEETVVTEEIAESDVVAELHTKTDSGHLEPYSESDTSFSEIQSEPKEKPSFFARWRKKILPQNEAQKNWEKILKSKKLAQTLSKSKSLALLDEETMNLIFNQSQEWFLSEKDTINIYELLQMVVIILRAQRGGRPINLALKIQETTWRKKIAHPETVLDDFLTHGARISHLEQISIRGIEKEKIFGAWKTGSAQKMFQFPCEILS